MSKIIKLAVSRVGTLVLFIIHATNPSLVKQL